MAEPSDPTAAEPTSSTTTCAHAARRLLTEPPGFTKGPHVPFASIPSLPHLLSLKLINSCPNAPGQPGSSSWPLLPAVPSRLLGGPRQLLPAGTHTSGPVSCRRLAGRAKCRLFPAAQLVQPGAVGAEERVWGTSHQFEDVHPTQSKGRAPAAPRESQGITPVMLNLCKPPALTHTKGFGDGGSSKQQGLGEDQSARPP